ncbi:Outer membrane porin protein 32 [Paraburkholderia domus]|uniref:Outer membrane porin protein 32 n=1 Tax=Paraburkholderia domus TaxID=2793075 RepID=A0A9N8R532_9BURK|nr:porin [Paraburkholderia domus]MBK5053700.1 porin [Burkholderia sp. R-70006]MBK5065533.1 porin [Burkholderia sp. R-70199]MBK5090652.1 porin [Burkholderia sp. R-69927]MBK5125312.1 porin [Burkholderia sp. R-69980]MBK5169498.1 porin [Burkholderia sp. R-70211]MBK5184925.1 porin [Burkholderia sp. R-69749]MCI0151090.1 porin [Paraburkholderia sediminicola]
MKNVSKWAMAVVPAALACQMAHAQSSVTLYGVIDESVRYLTHANQAGDSSIGLGNGGMTESRWGIRGVEDLGGGWSTFFKLENRFYMNSGQSDPTLPFFNEAQVGVRSDSYGQVILGRQYNVMIEGITIGGYGSNIWIPYDFSFQPEVTMTGGIWTSNQVQYQAKYNGFHLAAGYAFGGNAGNSYGSQIGAALAYAPGGPFTFGGAYQESKDSLNGAAAKAWTFGGSYTWNMTRFSVGYIVDQNDAGFSNFANGPFTAPALAALKYTDFSRRRMIMGGITQQVGTTWHFAANVWRTLQDGKTAAQDGSAWQYQLVADYNLSRRTDVYLEGDYSLYRGDLIGAQLQGVNGVGLAQKGSQIGLMAGVRHQF